MFPILMIAFLKFPSFLKIFRWWQRGKSKLCCLLEASYLVREKRGWEVAAVVQVQPDVGTPRGAQVATSPVLAQLLASRSVRLSDAEWFE